MFAIALATVASIAVNSLYDLPFDAPHVPGADVVVGEGPFPRSTPVSSTAGSIVLAEFAERENVAWTGSRSGGSLVFTTDEVGPYDRYMLTLDLYVDDVGDDGYFRAYTFGDGGYEIGLGIQGTTMLAIDFETNAIGSLEIQRWSTVRIVLDVWAQTWALYLDDELRFQREVEQLDGPMTSASIRIGRESTAVERMNVAIDNVKISGQFRSTPTETATWSEVKREFAR